jgi:hypothetical protein
VPTSIDPFEAALDEIISIYRMGGGGEAGQDSGGAFEQTRATSTGAFITSRSDLTECLHAALDRE